MPLTRDFNATLGFEPQAGNADKPPKRLHRMLSRSGNPTMNNLATIFQTLKNTLQVDLQAHFVRLSS